MKKKLQAILAFALAIALTLALSVTAWAAPAEELPDCDGYLVRLRPTVELLDGEERGVMEDVIRVEDKNQALPYIQEGLVEFMEPNYYIYLDEGAPTSEPTPQVMPQETAVPDTAAPLEAAVPPAPFVPNDYDKTKQWAAENIGLSYAWEHKLTGAGVRVAVIDSGVSPHEDFPEGALQPGHNYAYDDLRNEENGTIKPKRTAEDATDFYWHGTFVAGIIAAATNNGKGIVGMAPGVQIVPLRVFYKSTLSGKVTSTAEYVANAIADAATVYDCDVLNLSLGLSSNSSFVMDAVTRATAAGAIVVASVGNDGTGTVYYPAGYHGVVGVGSIGSEGKVSDFSQKNDSVSVVAPGGSVYSLHCPSGAITNGYTTSSGTSFSAPHVAGMAALAKQQRPALSSVEFERILQRTAIPVDGVEQIPNVNWGYGKVAVGAFFEALSTGLLSGAVDKTADPADPSKWIMNLTPIVPEALTAEALLTVAVWGYDSDGRLCAQSAVDDVGANKDQVRAVPYSDEAVRYTVTLLDRTTLAPLAAPVSCLVTPEPTPPPTPPTPPPTPPTP